MREKRQTFDPDALLLLEIRTEVGPPYYYYCNRRLGTDSAYIRASVSFIQHAYVSGSPRRRISAEIPVGPFDAGRGGPADQPTYPCTHASPSHTPFHAPPAPPPERPITASGYLSLYLSISLSLYLYLS